MLKKFICCFIKFTVYLYSIRWLTIVKRYFNLYDITILENWIALIECFYWKITFNAFEQIMFSKNLFIFLIHFTNSISNKVVL